MSAGTDCGLSGSRGAGVAGRSIRRRRWRVLPGAAGQGRSAEPRSRDGHLDGRARPPVLGVCALARARPTGGEGGSGSAEDGHTTAASRGNGGTGQ